MTIRYIDPEHAAWHLHAPWCRCWQCEELPEIPHIIFQMLSGSRNDWHQRASWLVHR